MKIAANMGNGINIWSMDPVSKSATETVVQLPSWQKSLVPGQSYTFGFTLSPIQMPVFGLR